MTTRWGAVVSVLLGCAVIGIALFGVIASRATSTEVIESASAPQRLDASPNAGRGPSADLDGIGEWSAGWQPSPPAGEPSNFRDSTVVPGAGTFGHYRRSAARGTFDDVAKERDLESAAALAGLIAILVFRPWRCEDRGLRNYSALAVAVLSGLLLITLSLKAS